MISIPAFREEGDTPLWRSRCFPSQISIPAFREEGDPYVLPVARPVNISIPAFREEGDNHSLSVYIISCDISIPAFREEGDAQTPNAVLTNILFQSPPSVRKATLVTDEVNANNIISIPAFREEGDRRNLTQLNAQLISIPAFREEGDRIRDHYANDRLNFNPRLP